MRVSPTPTFGMSKFYPWSTRSAGVKVFSPVHRGGVKLLQVRAGVKELPIGIGV